MLEITSIPEIRIWTTAQRAAGRRIALVPTMGYLHEGHLALVDEARRRADSVVLSIFINPLQFGPQEDLGRYPRDLPRDRALARDHGVDALFVPSVDIMYPPGSEIRLALSSRNAYLSEEDRSRAVVLSRALLAAHRAFCEGERRASALEQRMRQQ